jgi:mono/diheme cytochrome c family protein
MRLVASILLASTILACPAFAEEVDEARIELGRQVFTEIAQPQCALCHTLADAEAAGEIGPVLDQLRPDFERVRKAVVDGIGPMQPNEVLTDEEVDAVAYYVSTVTAPE